jgi:RimJ/RimL family protein N-acetyltransferase
MIVAETDRLVISEFTIEDAPFYLELVNTPHWIQYIGDRNIKTIEQAENALKNNNIKSYTDNGFGFYKLLLKSENLKPVGTCGLIKREYLEDIDIGFAMLPEYERKGLGYESAAKIIQLAKHQFKIKRIVAITLPNNKGSIALLEKLGLNYEKTIIPFDDDEELLLFAKHLE